MRVVGKRAEVRGYLDGLGMALPRRACEHAQAMIYAYDAWWDCKIRAGADWRTWLGNREWAWAVAVS